jgi:hypothetical protein
MCRDMLSAPVRLTERSCCVQQSSRVSKALERRVHAEAAEMQYQHSAWCAHLHTRAHLVLVLVLLRRVKLLRFWGLRQRWQRRQRGAAAGRRGLRSRAGWWRRAQVAKQDLALAGVGGRQACGHDAAAQVRCL